LHQILVRRSWVIYLAPHTSGPRGVPRCGALSLLQTALHYRGDPAETAATPNVKLCVLPAWCLPGRELPPIEPHPLSNLIEESTNNLASQFCGGAMRTIAPSMPSRACPGRAAGGPCRGLVPQAPTAQT
jgi:hypothetical protein